MPKPVKCPKCAQVMDIEGMPAGTVVGCPACQAQLRVPGAAPAPVPRAVTPRGTPAAATPRGGVRRAGRTSAKLRAISDPEASETGRQRTLPKKSKTGLIVGVVVGVAVVLVAIIAIVMTRGGEAKPPAAPAARGPRPAPPVSPFPVSPTPAPVPAAPVPVPSVETSAPDPRRASRAPRDRRTWDRIVGGLKKHASKGFDTGRWEFEHEVDPDCARSFSDVKGMGPDAYPYLLAYLTNEDPMSVQAAAATLWTLLDREGRKPRRDEGAAMRAQFMLLLNVSENDLRRAMQDLGMEQ
jgi:hypothetical protein